MSETSQRSSWWGDFEIPLDEGRAWRVGPARFWIERRTGEWSLRHETAGDPFDDALEVAVPAPISDLAELTGPVHRFADGSSTPVALRLRPRLADRDVISRPEKPFSVLPESEVTVHMGSSVWAAIERLPGARAVTEFPLLRPSDTWFGPDSRTGQLCYASRTRCRMAREDIRALPHRAVTTVTIRNPRSTPLRVERISLPAPTLELWTDGSGALHTSSIVYTCAGDDEDRAELETVGAPPDGATTQVAEPRHTARSGLVRAFSRLI